VLRDAVRGHRVGRPLAEIALRFGVSNPHVAVTIIPGMRTPEQARSNAAACEPLPANVVET
jgi:aryl-alcohol dehydrogenase-like predicted oxidoreductase